MPQLIVRQVEEKLVKQLKARAGLHGVSVEEHRRILREALLGKAAESPSFKEYLLTMPNVGSDNLSTAPVPRGASSPDDGNLLDADVISELRKANEPVRKAPMVPNHS